MNTISICNRVFFVLGMTALGSLTQPSLVAAQSQFPNATVTHQTDITTDATASKISKAIELTNSAPVPGTSVTSAAALTAVPQTKVESTPEDGNRENTYTTTSTQVAQGDIDLGRSTRGGSSYIGLAGNIGLNGGESSLGDGNFAVISKVGLTRTLSVRPAAIFGDTTSIILPVTYDFPFAGSDDPFSEPLPIAPYLGVGAAITTGDDSEIGFLVSGGIDLPLTEKFTATAAVNAGFFNETDIGLLLGVGYNFR